MGFLHLYYRVVKLLGSDQRLGWVLSFANVSLACVLFAEPIIFGRVIDCLLYTSYPADDIL
jgi:hypothetical protein